jgi:MscS family membrane protein
MAFNERFNMEVFTRFNQAGIDFAFPTQTIHLAGDNKRPLSIGVRQRQNG